MVGSYRCKSFCTELQIEDEFIMLVVTVQWAIMCKCNEGMLSQTIYCVSSEKW